MRFLSTIYSQFQECRSEECIVILQTKTIRKQEKTTETVQISKNLRVSHLELLFLTVLALPNASRTGFDCTVSVDTKAF